MILGSRVSICGQRHDKPGDPIYVLDYPTESNEQGSYSQRRKMRDPETGRHLVRFLLIFPPVKLYPMHPKPKTLLPPIAQNSTQSPRHTNVFV